jgi:hypothetical protein
VEVMARQGQQASKVMLAQLARQELLAFKDQQVQLDLLVAMARLAQQELLVDRGAQELLD